MSGPAVVQFGKVPYPLIDGGIIAQMTGGSAKTYLALCAHVDGTTWRAQVGVRRLARLTGMLAGSVSEILQDLERIGAIEIRRGGNGRPNEYRILTVRHPPNASQGWTVRPTPRDRSAHAEGPFGGDRSAHAVKPFGGDRTKQKEQTEPESEQIIKQKKPNTATGHNVIPTAHADTRRPANDSGSIYAHSDSDSDSGNEHERNLAYQTQYLPGFMPLIGRSENGRHSVGSKQHNADMTCIRQWWDDVIWPSGVGVQTGKARLAKLLRLCEQAKGGGKHKPMAWLASRIGKEFTP